MIRKVVGTPGVYMYHCASGPVTDIHIKNGLYGAMIVYPREEMLRPAREPTADWSMRRYPSARATSFACTR